MRLLRRERRRLLAFMAAMAWVVAQLLVAAHACPRASGSGEPSAAGVHAHCSEAMPDQAPSDDDPDGSALCQQHCNGQAAQQAEDLVGPMALAPLQDTVVLVVQPEAADPLTRAWTVRKRQREHPRPTPHCISHCVWRI